MLKEGSLLLYIIRGIASRFCKLLATWHLPFTKKRITYSDVKDSLSNLKLGDIILTRTNGEISSLLIPGQWKHAMIYIGNGLVVEAVFPKVKISFLLDCVLKTDYVKVIRPRYFNDEDCKNFVDEALNYVGTDYDLRFDLFDMSTMYCSEVVYHAYNVVASSKLIAKCYRGIYTYTPNDLNNSIHFYTVVEI